MLHIERTCFIDSTLISLMLFLKKVFTNTFVYVQAKYLIIMLVLYCPKWEIKLQDILL